MLTATDKGTIRIIVIAAAVIALACVGGVIALSATQTPVPNVLDTLAIASLTGLFGLLAKTSSGAGAAEAINAQVAAQAAGLQVPPNPGEVAVEAHLVVDHGDDPNIGAGL